jgi:hypothetical protein
MVLALPYVSDTILNIYLVRWLRRVDKSTTSSRISPTGLGELPDVSETHLRRCEMALKMETVVFPNRRNNSFTPGDDILEDVVDKYVLALRINNLGHINFTIPTNR